MNSSGWRISSWSKEHARGAIESGAGVLPFDAAIAEVDDFTVGEPVEVELRRSGETYQVARIRPLNFRSALPPALDAPPPSSLVAAVRDLTSLLEHPNHVLVLVAAAEARLELLVIDKDWPPPHQKPLGSAEFEGVAYIQLPTGADHFHRVVAWRWEAVEAHRPKVCAGLALGPGDVEPDSFLFSFEPSSFGEAAGFVVAKSLRTAKRGFFTR